MGEEGCRMRVWEGEGEVRRAARELRICVTN